jgi:FMNH2-dependent dimethyl sulfone monooxygenase
LRGDPSSQVREKIRDLSARHDRLGLPPMKFGVAGYVIARENEEEAGDELGRRRRRTTQVLNKGRVCVRAG